LSIPAAANPVGATLADLVARSALHDRRAFAALYRHTSAKLYAVALRIVRRQDWAEEVLQESFVNIWNHIGDYSADKGAPTTWMTAIVRNRALDWLRRPGVERGSEDYDALVAGLSDAAPSPEQLVAGARDADRLARCLRELSGIQRQCITLAYVQGLSHAELAAHMQEPLGTVKTWIRRGLERLRVCMEAAPR
jgi:RNA polymerase sigma-70 factor (ECF subfamily)